MVEPPHKATNTTTLAIVMIAFSPRVLGDRTITCSVAAIRLTRELKGKDQPKTQVVVLIRRVVVVPVGGAAVRRIVEVAAATFTP